MAAAAAAGAHSLMRRGKRAAADVVGVECADGAADTPQLHALLDVLLHPTKAIDDWELLDWCRWLMAAGRLPDEFASIVRGYDNHAKCGLVWIPHVVAYRCRTCGISPCMSICRDCFRRGNHSTHDFNMFLSQAGGACDCGDTSVMKEDGFCSNHGINNCANKSPAPVNLMCVAEAMMPRVILRLLQHFRENSETRPHVNPADSYRIAVQESEMYVSMLMEFNNMGELMRKVMTKTLINPQVYKNMVEPPFPNTPYGSYLAKSKTIYEMAVKTFPAPDPPDEYKSLPALGKEMHHTTLLEEFIFWTFKYEFPQNVVCFLLNMLPDQDYKEHLTRTFVMHYARIPLVLELSLDPDMLSNRVVHMSVQLFSNETLALRMVEQLSLLHVMVISLKLMMTKILIQNTLHDQDKNCHYVIDCAKRVMKEHCYWPLVSDFNNVLSHKSVALVFLREDTLIDMWFEFLSMLQGMNVNVRELGSHVEFEPSSYYAAFSCELEASAYPMWSIISHLTDSTHADLAKKLLRYCLNYLKEWLNAIYFTRPHIDRSEAMRASFHFPLHRYYAAFICQAVRHMGVPITELLPHTDMLMLLMMHPLRVQSLFYEILNGIWVRNGLQIKGQAMTYIQANFCNSMVDMDIYFLQVCASHLPHTQFLDICINTFGVNEWLSMAPLNPVQEQEQETMVDGLLTFLAMIVSSRTNLGNDELTQSRLEISTLLATGDKTHSQLLELMPERSGNAHTKNFETVLKELSYYRAPPKGSETLEQGQFAPRAIVWSHHYDPLHVLQRAVHRKEFLNSMERFTAYVQSSGLAPKNRNEPLSSGTWTGSGNRAPTLWPPLRLPKGPLTSVGCDPRKITCCGRLHAALLSVLHRAVHRRRPPAEHVLALAIYLLEVAADVEQEELEKINSSQKDDSLLCQWTSGHCGRSLLYSYFSDKLSENASVTLHDVALPPSPPHSLPNNNFPTAYDSDSDTEWDASENDRSTGNSRVAPAITAGEFIPITHQPVEADNEDDNLNGVVARDTRALIMHDHIMTEDDQMSLQEETFQLALPSPESLNNQMSVVIQTDMAMVPTTPDVSEVFPSEGSSSIGSTGSGSAGSAALCLPYTRVQPAPPPPPPPPPLTPPPPPLTTRTMIEKAKTYAIVKSSTKNRPSDSPSRESNMVPINESLISVLLKLHSQLSGCLDSFSLDDENVETVRRDATMENENLTNKSSVDIEHESCDLGSSMANSNIKYSSSSGSVGNIGASSSNSDKQNQSNSDSKSKSDNEKNSSDNRIGDGPYFIGNLLHKLCKLDKRNSDEIAWVRAALWPRQRERQAEERAREQREREERTRRARERQRILMQDFAHRQNAFMKKAMETDECVGMEWQDEEEEVLEKEYDCIICNTTSPSTESNPIGLVVLLQSTSVVGHRRRGQERPSLPLSDNDKLQYSTSRDCTIAAEYFRRHHEMDQNFDSESWQVSVNVGWEGGVHVQSCGHHVHLACLQAYLRSLTNPQRPHNLHIDRGEFLCPVCRQLANSVLPLSPQLGRASLVRCQPPETPTLVSEILNFLKDCQQPPNSSKLSEAMVKAMEDMANSTHLRFKQRGSTPNHQTLLLFVSSVARTNLEAELVQRGGSLAAPNPRYKPRRDCIVPLLHVLAVHARVLAQWSVSSWWNQLTTAPADGMEAENDASKSSVTTAPFPGELVVAGVCNNSSEESLGVRELPLLLKDPVAILIHFLLLAPLHLELPYFTCMVRVLYNLTYYQIIAQMLSCMNAKQREIIRTNDTIEVLPKTGLVHAATLLMKTLCNSEIFADDDPYEGASTSSKPDKHSGLPDFASLEKELQSYCLPYLRIAALLRHHLYGEPLPQILESNTEFFHLVCYLDLITKDISDTSWGNFDASYALQWCGGPEGSESALVSHWATGLDGAATRCPAPTRRLLFQYYPWSQPALLRLPKDYDRLFTYYHERICSQCGAVPKEASVCLLCGTVICLKQQCCRQQEVCEAVSHSIDCGGGTGIFLVVTSTYIIIIRGRRACLWGSLYLDDYDEEDRDLKRGKPLYLSEDRFELLEQQWLAHRFDHTKRTWVWHRDSL